MLLRLLLLCLPILLLAGLPLTAAAMPADVLEVSDRSNDDPRATLQLVLQRRSQAEAGRATEMQFWWTVVATRLHAQLEHLREAQASAADARTLLDKLPQAGEPHRRWLRLSSFDASAGSDDSATLVPKVTALRQHAEAIGEARLACEATTLELWLLIDLRSDDEAWLAAESLERCASRLGLPEIVAYASRAFATLTRFRLADGQADARPERHLERALQALGSRPARFSRSLIEWEAGISLRHQKLFEPALARLQQARALSRELKDDAGVAAADIEIAAVLLELDRPGQMLPLLAEAPRLLAAHSEADLAYRMPRVMELRIRALEKLSSPQVLQEIEAAHHWLKAATTNRAALQRAMAAGFASQRRHVQAYDMLLAAHQTDQQARQVARDGQLLRLQARYEAARRDAEYAELRLRSEAGRLALQTETERRRTLTAGIVALAAVAVLAFSYGWREWSRRRRLLDLALRDELTGLPNRRAVTTYAEEQFRQARRLNLAMSVAMLDLDHFKAVNDRHGHAVGDAVLRAFAQAASGALRGQDRIGRWGGEEWLLVMPGTGLDETSALFERVRRRFAATPIAGLPRQERCTFSMGVAEIGPEVRDLAALIAAADGALYSAKDSGRDRCETAPLPARAVAAEAPPPARDTSDEPATLER